MKTFVQTLLFPSRRLPENIIISILICTKLCLHASQPKMLNAHKTTFFLSSIFANSLVFGEENNFELFSRFESTEKMILKYLFDLTKQ